MSIIKNICTLLVLSLFLPLSGCSDGDEPRKEPDAEIVTIVRAESPLQLSVESSADGTDIPVYLALPEDRTTPLKAVLVLHGSGGPWNDKDHDGDDIAEDCRVGEPSAQTREWRDLLTENGYAAVFADSYSPRGTCENEGPYKEPPLKFDISGTFVRNRDAYDVLALLRSLRWSDDKTKVIDGENIAVLGFSDGGTTVISTLYDNTATPAAWQWKQSFSGTTYTDEVMPPVDLPEEGGFKAGVLFYPGSYHNGYYGKLCDEGEGIYRSYCKMLFHIAEEDPLSENTLCLIETMNFNGGGEALAYQYLGADHGFDGSDEPHSSLARERTLEFLNDVLN